MKFNKTHLHIIEKNHEEHFKFLPELLNFDSRQIKGVTIVNCGLKSSMFNIAYGTPLENSDFSAITDAFNQQPFAWWIPPSAHDPRFTKMLLANNFILETTEHAMICDLKNSPQIMRETKLIIKPIDNELLLQDFINVLEPYDKTARLFYQMLGTSNLSLDERLFVGYENNRPVTISIMFINAENCAIFSLITNDQDQGKGYGTDMMHYLLQVARKSGHKYATLSASSDSGYRIYERLGFCKIGEFECFEWKGN